MQNRSVTDFELRKRLNAAIEKNKYFITITTLEGKKLSHFSTTRNFPEADIIPTLEHLAAKLEKEMYSDV